METKEWKRRFLNRLIERGLSLEEADDIFQAGGHDFDFEPEDSADDELSYWPSDG